MGVRPEVQRDLYPITEGGATSSRDDGAEAEEELCEPCGLEGEQQGVVAKAMKVPLQPTQKMIDDHEIGHIPFRPWRAACVRGRGESTAHRACKDKPEDIVPVVSLDYGFFGTEEGSKVQEIGSSKLPILVMKDRSSKAKWSNPVPCKGTEDVYALQNILKNLDETGYKKVILKSDQEPAIKALVEAAKTGWSQELIMEKSIKR